MQKTWIAGHGRQGCGDHHIKSHEYRQISEHEDVRLRGAFYRKRK